MSNLFTSVFLTALMSFAAPVMLISCVMVVFGLVAYVPGFWELSDRMTSYILEFLAVFGDGKPLQGIVTLGLTISFVGVLLDILNFYRYQSIRDQDLN